MLALFVVTLELGIFYVIGELKVSQMLVLAGVQAKRTLLMRHESDSKDNTYWLGMLTHLQAPSVSRKVK